MTKKAKEKEEEIKLDSQENIEEDSINNVQEDNENTLEDENLETSKEDAPIDPLEKAKEEIDALNDKYLRLAAEFDNYRKRTIKEKAELILNGSQKAVIQVLPILDDMERAIESASKTEDSTTLKQGIELIYQKFIKTLSSLGLSEIDTQDADFNTDYHEAIAMVPGVEDSKKGKILDCVQKGYMLNDIVIRHAKVAVGQ